jgi:hypothetical protein
VEKNLLSDICNAKISREVACCACGQERRMQESSN